MKEIIFSAPDYETLLEEAEILGFINEDSESNRTIITNGTFVSGGSWFLNIVGTVYEPVEITNPEDIPEPVARSGYWGRLRINGDATLPSFSESIEQYEIDEEGNWVDQYGDPAPDWLNNIGVIA
jgi:hypothetical protein